MLAAASRLIQRFRPGQAAGCGRWRGGLAVALLSSLLAAGPAGALELLGTHADDQSALPGYCARFSGLLAQDGVALEDYVTVEPAADTAVVARGNLLCLYGFTPATAHTVTLRQGLPGRDGSGLAESQSFAVQVPDRAPVVRFAGNGFILPRQGADGVALETVNVPALALKVYRASDRLLARLPFMRDPDLWETDRLTSQDVTLVWEGTMQVADPRPNARTLTSFPLARAVPQRGPGAWLLVAEDAGLKDSRLEPWQPAYRNRTAARWVVETDLALTTLSGRDGLSVIARRLSAASPVAGARAVLVARDNSVLGEQVTGGDGLAHFAPGLLRGRGGGAPAAVMLYDAVGDFAVQDLDRPAFDFSDRGVDGRAQAGPVDAFLYTDRGIYRPGEVVQVGLHLRDGQARAVADTPVILRVLRPDGVEFQRQTLRPRAGGAVATVTLTDTARRGGWSLLATLDGADTVVGQGSFTVQDFVPQRLAVTLAPPEGPALIPGTPVELTATARFLYGAAAADLPAGADLVLRRATDPFPVWKGFHFGLEDDPYAGDRAEAAPVRTGVDGIARPTLPVPPVPETATIPLEAQVSVAVTEPGGRVTGDSITLPVRRGDLWLGLKPGFADGRAPVGAAAGFQVVALDGAGTATARPGVRWRLFRIERDYVWFDEGGGWSWRATEREWPIEEGTLDVAADTPSRLDLPVDWGLYRLEVADAGGAARTSLRFEAGWHGAADSADTPDRARVTSDKPAYRPGEVARLRVEPPFAGQMQVVIANDRVISVLNRAVGDGPVTVEVPVEADWGAGGAYALVSLLRPVQGGTGHRPVRAVGLVWLGLDGADSTLAVDIQAPERVRPRGRVDIPVQVTGTQGEAFVTLAAVDEGILQLTRFDTPDPAGHYFGQRRLAVDMRDDYGRLLDGKAGRIGTYREGGDGSLGGAGLTTVPSRTVALFSGLVRLDGQGRAVVPLDIPDFAGSLRLMAVAWDGRAVGAARRDMLVRDPLVAELVLPRFLAPDDRATATLLLHNVEQGDGEYGISLEATGPVSLASGIPAGPALRLAAGERRLLPVEMVAGAPGTATLALGVRGPDGLDIRRDWSITIRPAQAPVTLAETVQQAPGEAFTLPPGLWQPFLDGTVRVTLGYSRLPGIDVPGLLAELNRYPYGCTEQITSVAMPLLALGPVAGALGLGDPDDPGLALNEAVLTLLDRQNAQGGFGLWGPDDGGATPWLSLYVIDFLARARAAGQAVPAAALDRAMGWVDRYVDGGLDGEAARLQALAYALWLQGRAGTLAVGDVRYLHDVQGERMGDSPLAQAMLGATLAAIGDTARAQQAFQRARERLGRSGADLYATPLRETAATLAVAAEAGDKETQEAAATALQGALARPFDLNTQEKGWLLLAARAMLEGGGPPSLSLNGVAVAGARTEVAVFRPGRIQAEQGYAVTNTGAGPLWRSLTMTGVPKTAPPPVQDKGLTLTRQVFLPDGTPVDPARVARDSRLVVVLTGRMQHDGRRSLVMVDPLPAGWEVETVLRPGAENRPATLPWVGELSRPAVLEGRDDRLVAVLENGLDEVWERQQTDGSRGPDLRAREYRIAYVVRVVTPGDFARPPASIQDMYAPDQIARTDSGRTLVTAGAP